MTSSSILKIAAAGAVASLLAAGTAAADSRRCLAEASGDGWRVRGTAIYGDAGMQGSGMVMDMWARAQGLKPGSNLQFNTIVGHPNEAFGWIRVWSLESDVRHVSVEVDSPEVFSVNAAMLSGFDKDAAPPPPLKLTVRMMLDGRSAFSAAASVVKPAADFQTSAVGMEQIKLGDFKTKDYHDAEATDLAMKLYSAGTVKVETIYEDGSVVGSFEIPRAVVQSVMAARATVRAEMERKYKAGECQTLKANL